MILGRGEIGSKLGLREAWGGPTANFVLKRVYVLLKCFPHILWIFGKLETFSLSA